MFQNLWRIAFGERRDSNSTYQDHNTPEAIEEKVVVKEFRLKSQDDSSYNNDPDLDILAKTYGELDPGKVIEIELNTAAKLLGRKRIKVDAFDALKRRLKNDYDVELRIYSRRTKLNKKGEKI